MTTLLNLLEQLHVDAERVEKSKKRQLTSADQSCERAYWPRYCGIPDGGISEHTINAGGSSALSE